MASLKDKLLSKPTWPGIGSTVLTDHHRKSIGASKKLTKYALPVPVNAAGPRNFSSSELVGFPKMDAVRRGADDHLSIKNIGIEAT